MEIKQNIAAETFKYVPGAKNQLKRFKNTENDRSEGIARTGYLIPGRDGIPGLDVARNSSAVAVVAVAVALGAWTDGHATKKIKRCYFGVQKGPCGHRTGDTEL